MLESIDVVARSKLHAIYPFLSLIYCDLLLASFSNVCDVSRKRPLSIRDL